MKWVTGTKPLQVQNVRCMITAVHKTSDAEFGRLPPTPQN